MPRTKIEIDLKKVEEYAQVCDSEQEIALALGISQDTFTRRKKDRADFAEALKRGKAKANIFVGGKLMELIKNGNVAATIFYLKSRCGWTEKQDVELKADVDVKNNTDIKSLSDAQLIALAKLNVNEIPSDSGAGTKS